MKDRQVDSIQNMSPCTYSIRVVPSRLSVYRSLSPKYLLATAFWQTWSQCSSSQCRLIYRNAALARCIESNSQSRGAGSVLLAESACTDSKRRALPVYIGFSRTSHAPAARRPWLYILDSPHTVSPPEERQRKAHPLAQHITFQG